MDKAYIGLLGGLLGVVLGVSLTVAKEWWFDSRKSKKEAEYLCIHIVCMLERFAGKCIDVVYDDGLFQGQPDKDGRRHIQVSLPDFEPESVDVEWKSLPAKLMYEILNLPSDIEIANAQINGVFEYVTSPPDYEEGFEERQYQYATLGIKSLNLAAKLRKHVGLPKREVGDWDLFKQLNDEKDKIESLRNMRVEEREKRNS
ncbi:hypothetical protein [Mariprofundus ferrooxydans]|uniref:hypothetical protein n=1 Tax=Mariprofundus ferrooxydans TaxID=314344 RepID=UPI00142FADDA|nr:hypothetical protein [Mariprofundus ferrooxydans]